MKPKKPKTVTPGLRIDFELWKSFTAMYPRKVNKMFTEWVKKQTQNN